MSAKTLDSGVFIQGVEFKWFYVLLNISAD
jgi:hypothetical protein